jgi:hypothetical protein
MSKVSNIDLALTLTASRSVAVCNTRSSVACALSPARMRMNSIVNIIKSAFWLTRARAGHAGHGTVRRLLDPEIKALALEAGLNQSSRSCMPPDTLSYNRPVERPWPVLDREVAAMLVRRKRRKAPVSERREVVQRPPLWTVPYPLAPTLGGAPEPWGSAAITFGLSGFGFLASRFPRFCPLAIGITCPPCAQLHRGETGTVRADARA